MSNTKSPDSDASNGGVEDTKLDDTATATNTKLPASNQGLVRVGFVALVVIILDQGTKIWAASALADRDIDLFWTARLHLIKNFGSAFGLGSGLGRWLGLLIIGVVISLILYARTVSDPKALFLFGGIIGGAIGNIIDRVARAEDGFLSGGVVDFIDFQWWPVFNVADISVVLSASALLLLSLREPTHD